MTDREEFEALMRERGEDYLYRRDSKFSLHIGEYCRQNVQDQWEIWQAARATAEQSLWQPIETAPAEGQFLVYMPEERNPIQVAKWHPNVKIIGNCFAFDLSAPTYWQPLPTPPAAAIESQRSGDGS